MGFEPVAHMADMPGKPRSYVKQPPCLSVNLSLPIPSSTASSPSGPTCPRPFANAASASPRRPIRTPMRVPTHQGDESPYQRRGVGAARDHRRFPNAPAFPGEGWAMKPSRRPRAGGRLRPSAFASARASESERTQCYVTPVASGGATGCTSAEARRDHSCGPVRPLREWTN